MAGDDHVLVGILVGEWCRCREQECVREGCASTGGVRAGARASADREHQELALVLVHDSGFGSTATGHAKVPVQSRRGKGSFGAGEEPRGTAGGGRGHRC